MCLRNGLLRHFLGVRVWRTLTAIPTTGGRAVLVAVQLLDKFGLLNAGMARICWRGSTLGLRPHRPRVRGDDLATGGGARRGGREELNTVR